MICSCIFITVCFQTPGITYINTASSSWTTSFVPAAARREGKWFKLGNWMNEGVILTIKLHNSHGSTNLPKAKKYYFI
jgi:hypothetical protein